MIAEIYPSLLDTEIKRRKRPKEKNDEAQVRVNAEAFACLDETDELEPLFKGDPDLNDNERRDIETEEGWILGVGSEDVLRKALNTH